MMNQYIFSYSESLVLSLSKEIEYIKIRSSNINSSLKNCQNKILSTRLLSELDKFYEKFEYVIYFTMIKNVKISVNTERHHNFHGSFTLSF